MRKSAFLAQGVPILLCGFCGGGEPRFITEVEDVRPLLQQYSRDPFRFPGIWSLDAKDPFEMDLKAMVEPVAVRPPQPLPKSEPTIGGIRPPTPAFLRKMGTLQPQEAVIAPASEPSSPREGVTARFTPEGELNAGPGQPRFMRPYLIATAPFLTDVGLRGKVFPGERKIRYRSSNESEVLQPMEEIEFETNGDVKTGDLFQIYEVGEPYRSFRKNRALGRLVQVNGLAEVVRLGSGYAVARLVRCFGTVSRRSRAAPMGDLPEVRATGYAQASGSLRVSRVVWVTPPHQIPQPFSQAIVDGGSQDGFQVGDFIILLDRRNGKMTDRILGNAVVLRADPHSSTLLLQDVNPGVINPGDFAVAHLSPTP